MKGKCLCGQVEFEVKGILSNLYQCSCSICRKASGSSKSSSFITTADGIRWLKGENVISSFTNENGFRTDFCSNCGSPVPNKMNIGNYICVPAGSLDGEFDREIVAKIFIESKASWDKSSVNCRNLSEGPKDIEEFVNFLHQGLHSS